MASSLSADAKDALAREVPQPPHCRAALLGALAYYGRTADGRFLTHRNPVARLFRALFEERAEWPIHTEPGRRLQKLAAYSLDLPERLRGTPPRPAKRCDRSMELRAAFLTCGSLSSGAHGYHLEFALGGSAQAERLSALLAGFERRPRRLLRRGRTVLYFKEFDAIEDVLTLCGAFGAVLALEDLRALRETKNRIHRLVNTEAANLERAVAAGALQRRTIDFLAHQYGLERLSPALREIAALRLAHPEESLAQLGQRCDPPAGKPTVGSRLGALARLAQRLGAPAQGKPRPAR
ncbi:MAG: DNA-binding protein WhiA [Vulcanimicrobiaceae bacterium]